MRAVIRLSLTILISAATAGAQATPTKPLPPERRICDMSLRIVSLQLRTAAGAPVSGATITVRRVHTRTLVDRAEAMGDQGDYKVIEDGTLTDLRPGGEPFDVTFRHGARVRRVRLIIGMDAGGCHVALRSGPTRVTI